MSRHHAIPVFTIQVVNFCEGFGIRFNPLNAVVPSPHSTRSTLVMIFFLRCPPPMIPQLLSQAHKKHPEDIKKIKTRKSKKNQQREIRRLSLLWDLVDGKSCRENMTLVMWFLLFGEVSELGKEVDEPGGKLCFSFSAFSASLRTRVYRCRLHLTLNLMEELVFFYSDISLLFQNRCFVVDGF